MKSPQIMIRSKRVFVTSKNPIIKILAALARFSLNLLRTVKRIIADSEYRSILLLQFLQAKEVHQTTPLTGFDRYPGIFAACREYLSGKANLNILSYGCSTGEEVLTLRKYFPHAHIIGAEINNRSLSICKSRPVDANIMFVNPTRVDLKTFGPFDAVFCMAVLQRQPHYIAAKGITSLKNIYPFEKFERKIVELDELVHPQGLLVVHYSQYSVADTAVASNYTNLGDFNQDDYTSPVFDRNSSIIRNPGSRKSIFIKLQK